MTSDDELLAAYLDGVAELDVDERRRVETLLEARPELRVEAEATRALIGQLRALPVEGQEPDFAALERSIRETVGPTVPRTWWRRFRWLVPITALAAATTVALVWLHHPAEPVIAHARPVPDAGAPVEAVREAQPATAIWLDGEAIDVGNVDPAVLLDDFNLDTRDTLASETDSGSDLGGILPVDDLGWVDALDDTAIDRAEHWLARKKG